MAILPFSFSIGLDIVTSTFIFEFGISFGNIAKPQTLYAMARPSHP